MVCLKPYVFMRELIRGGHEVHYYSIYIYKILKSYALRIYVWGCKEY